MLRLRQAHTDEKGRPWSQAYLAELTGMTQPAIAEIEKGNRGVKLDEARAIAEAFYLTLDQMLGEAPTDTKTTTGLRKRVRECASSSR